MLESLKKPPPLEREGGWERMGEGGMLELCSNIGWGMGGGQNFDK